MRKSITFGLLVFIFVLIGGCTKTVFMKLESQSHYTDPNVDITLLGRVHGESSTYGILPFTDAWVDSKLKLNAINDALAKDPRANLLINVAHINTITFYPSPLYGLFSVTKFVYTVDGQAAKQENISIITK